MYHNKKSVRTLSVWAVEERAQSVSGTEHGTSDAMSVKPTLVTILIELYRLLLPLLTYRSV